MSEVNEAEVGSTTQIKKPKERKIKPRKTATKVRKLEVGDRSNILTNELVKTYDTDHDVSTVVDNEDYSVKVMSIANTNNVILWTSADIVIKPREQGFLMVVDEGFPIKYDIIKGSGLLFINLSTQFIAEGMKFVIEPGVEHRFINFDHNLELEFLMEYSGDIDFHSLFGQPHPERNYRQQEEIKRDKLIQTERMMRPDYQFNDNTSKTTPNFGV